MSNNENVNAALSILKSWGATSTQINCILNLGCGDETIERACCVLAIDSNIKTHFSNPKNITGFMIFKNNNYYFEGKSPLEVISSGSIADLKEVRNITRTMGTW
jgi:hypothetical protein